MIGLEDKTELYISLCKWFILKGSLKDMYPTRFHK